MGSILNDVITSKEISELYPMSDCTIRTWIKQGIIKDNIIRKSGNIWLIEKSPIEEIMKERGIFDKTIEIDKEKVFVRFFYKDRDFEIWFEKRAKIDIDKIPLNSAIPQIFKIYRQEEKMNFKHLIIGKDLDNSDNCYYINKKMWFITLKGLLTVCKDNFIEHNISINEFNKYLESNGVYLE